MSSDRGKKQKKDRYLDLPLPWGHQPDHPSDDPIAYLIAESLERYVCLAGYDRKPPRSCLFGARGLCAWAVHDAKARYCVWEWLRGRPEMRSFPEIAAALGMSREYIMQQAAEALEKLRCNQSKLAKSLKESY